MIRPALTWLHMYLLVMTWTPTYGRNSVTCTATTSDTRSTVTCLFHGDLGTLKKNFNVQFYYPGTSSDAEMKLMCNWLISGSMRCKTGQGLDFNNTVSDRLTFTGPAMVDKIGGQFVCDVLSPGVRAIPCNLTFEDTSTEAETTMLPSTIPTADPDCAQDHGYSAVSIATLVLVTVLLLLVAGLLALLLYKHRASLAPILNCKTWRRAGSSKFADKGPEQLCAAVQPLLQQADTVTTYTPLSGVHIYVPSDAATDSLGPSTKVYQLLVVGRTGTGKSSLANTIIGGPYLPVWDGNFTANTPTKASVVSPEKTVTVVDTPDLAMLGSDEEKKRQQISRWKEMTSPGPTAILLTIRCDVPFTEPDYKAYTELKALWGDDDAFCRRLLVVFTFGDKTPGVTHDKDGKDCPGLEKVLFEAANVHIAVSNIAAFEENRPIVSEILSLVDSVGVRVASKEKNERSPGCSQQSQDMDGSSTTPQPS